MNKMTNEQVKYVIGVQTADFKALVDEVGGLEAIHVAGNPERFKINSIDPKERLGVFHGVIHRDWTIDYEFIVDDTKHSFLDEVLRGKLENIWNPAESDARKQQVRDFLNEIKEHLL